MYKAWCISTPAAHLKLLGALQTPEAQATPETDRCVSLKGVRGPGISMIESSSGDFQLQSRLGTTAPDTSKGEDDGYITEPPET